MKKIVDISDWQYGISFDELKARYDGVIFKLAEGQTPTEHWREYAEEAERVGLPFGVYVYARALDEWEAEDEAYKAADLVMTEYHLPTLGIWYDVEAPHIVGENGGEGIGAEQITANISSFISTLNGENFWAGVYAPWWVIRDRINVNSLAKYVPYWVSYAATNGGNPMTENMPGVKCAGWQYAIDGTNGETVGGYGVDVSEWYI